MYPEKIWEPKLYRTISLAIWTMAMGSDRRFIVYRLFQVSSKWDIKVSTFIVSIRPLLMYSRRIWKPKIYRTIFTAFVRLAICADRCPRGLLHVPQKFHMGSHYLVFTSKLLTITDVFRKNLRAENSRTILYGTRKNGYVLRPSSPSLPPFPE